MPDKTRPSVAEAAIVFLNVCGGAPDINERLDRFLGKLSQDKLWTPSEVQEVRRLIIERLKA
jgi:hypothetical protein